MKLEREKLDFFKELFETAQEFPLDEKLFLRNIKVRYNPNNNSFSYIEIDPLMLIKVGEGKIGYNPLNGITVNPYTAKTQQDFLDDDQYDYLLSSDIIKNHIEKKFVPAYNDKVSEFENAYIEKYNTLRNIMRKNREAQDLQEIVNHYLKRK